MSTVNADYENYVDVEGNWASIPIEVVTYWLKGVGEYSLFQQIIYIVTFQNELQIGELLRRLLGSVTRKGVQLERMGDWNGSGNKHS